MKNIDTGLPACGYIIQYYIFNYILSHKKIYNTDGKHQLLSNIHLTKFSWQMNMIFLDI